RCYRDWSSDVCSSDLFITADYGAEPIGNQQQLLERYASYGQVSIQIGPTIKLYHLAQLLVCCLFKVSYTLEPQMQLERLLYCLNEILVVSTQQLILEAAERLVLQMAG